MFHAELAKGRREKSFFLFVLCELCVKKTIFGRGLNPFLYPHLHPVLRSQCYQRLQADLLFGN